MPRPRPGCESGSDGDETAELDAQAGPRAVAGGCGRGLRYPGSRSIPSEVGPSPPYATLDLHKVALYGRQLLPEPKRAFVARSSPHVPTDMGVIAVAPTRPVGERQGTSEAIGTSARYLGLQGLALVTAQIDLDRRSTTPCHGDLLLSGVLPGRTRPQRENSRSARILGRIRLTGH